MLRFTGSALHACDGFTRRDVLQAGGLSALGLFLPQITGRAEATSADSTFGRAKACVAIYLFGGPSQIDTFDHKPLVNQYAGRPLPKSVKRVFTPMAVT